MRAQFNEDAGAIYCAPTTKLYASNIVHRELCIVNCELCIVHHALCFSILKICEH